MENKFKFLFSHIDVDQMCICVVVLTAYHIIYICTLDMDIGWGLIVDAVCAIASLGTLDKRYSYTQCCSISFANWCMREKYDCQSVCKSAHNNRNPKLVLPSWRWRKKRQLHWTFTRSFCVFFPRRISMSLFFLSTAERQTDMWSVRESIERRTNKKNIYAHIKRGRIGNLNEFVLNYHP